MSILKKNIEKKMYSDRKFYPVPKSENGEEETLLLEGQKIDDDAEFLSNFGIELDEHKVAKFNNKRNVYENLYQHDSFSGKEIIKLCDDNLLTIKSTSKYKGWVPSDFRQVIESFMEIPHIKKNKVTLNSYNMYIMGPSESFDTKTKTKNLTLFYRDYDSTTTSYYNLIEDDDIFIKIHSWGDGYSHLRSLHHLSPYNFRKKEINLPRTFGALSFTLAMVVSLLTSMFLIPATLLITSFVLYQIGFSKQPYKFLTKK